MLWCINPGWTSAIINVERAFLQGYFENGEDMYMEGPNRFEEHYSGDVVLHMDGPIYGTKQVRYYLFKTFAKQVKNMTYEQ